jgi:tRNA/rRNA methyltransferase
MAARAQVVVVLVRTRNPLNMGAAARAMANFGFARLRVVQPYEAGFREARSAVGAAAVMRSAEEFATVAEALADCALVVGTTALRGREPQVPWKTLEQGAKAIRRTRGRVALLFGSEKRGLSNDDLSHCNLLIHIATEEKQPSMNLGQAVAVCLYELARVGRVAEGKGWWRRYGRVATSRPARRQRCGSW